MDFSEPRVLGRTGLRVGRLGIGAGYGCPADAAERAFHEHGINYFYWSLRKRARLTPAIHRLGKTHRDRLVVAIQSYDHLGLFLPGYVRKALKTLRLDYADVLILGWHNKVPPQRILDAALEARERQLIRFIAMSGHHRPTFGLLAKQAECPIDIFMVRYNAAHRGAETDVFPHLPAENRPGITTYTATRWGHLLSPKKMPKGEKPLNAPDCYRFALSNPNVDLCMTGPRSAAQLDEALQALSAGPLTPEEMTRIQRIGDHVHG